MVKTTSVMKSLGVVVLLVAPGFALPSSSHLNEAAGVDGEERSNYLDEQYFDRRSIDNFDPEFEYYGSDSYYDQDYPSYRRFSDSENGYLNTKLGFPSYSSLFANPYGMVYGRRSSSRSPFSLPPTYNPRIQYLEMGANGIRYA